MLCVQLDFWMPPSRASLPVDVHVPFHSLQAVRAFLAYNQIQYHVMINNVQVGLYQNCVLGEKTWKCMKHLIIFSCIYVFIRNNYKMLSWKYLFDGFLYHKDLLDDEKREMVKYRSFPRSTDDFVYTTYHDLNSVSGATLIQYQYKTLNFQHQPFKRNYVELCFKIVRIKCVSD